MKKNLVVLLSIVLFFSCQQEISHPNDQASGGSLKKDSNGDCLPVKVAGTYIKNQNIADTNWIEVDVTVTKTGTYLIRTDTVNGYSFKATGKFTTTGPVRIKLTGIGRPALAGTDIFTIRYDSSVCRVPVTVRNDLTGPAALALLGSPGSCMNAIVSGTFVKNIALDTSSKVMISVAVTTPGSYAISTNTVNGFSFSGTGTLSTAGTHIIQLTASGTPVNTGTNIFTVTAASNSCTFPVTVLTPIVVTGTDYFPLTQNSYWVYDDLRQPRDSVKRTIIDTLTISGNLYRIMRETLPVGGPVQYFFRKTGSDYFEHGPVDKYTASFQYGSPLLGLVPFLKENLVTGDSWVSAEYSGTATFGQVIILQYIYSCTNANATVTVNGQAFTNVYKIVMQPQIKSVGNQWGSTNETYYYYYAKGVGLIYIKKTNLGFTVAEWAIRSWLVN